MMDWQAIAADLSEKLNDACQIISASSVAGGDIHQAYKLHSNLGNFFLKANRKSSLPMFETEANALNTLNETLSIELPKAYATGVTDSHSWLLLQHLELSNHGDDFQRGKDLALMHQQIHREEKPFGWYEDNYIGHTPQKNQWSDNWAGFYGQNRLLVQIDMIEKEEGTSSLGEHVRSLVEQLDKFFQSYHPKASPLHGDLWGGNSAFLTSGEAVIYDPASYYGDREADIAMTELFGGFSADFYDGYNQVFPLDSGYKLRKDLYNLYHILNHYTLFGGGYARQAQNITQKLLKAVQ